MSIPRRSKISKANRLEEIYGAFRKDPLRLDELNFFRETDAARGKKTRTRLARQLRHNYEMDQRILFYGYRGCGKSTELRKLQEALMREFLVVNFSLKEELDPMNLHYIEVFIVAMERLFAAALEHDIPLSEEFLRSIRNWEQDKEVEVIKEKYNLSVEGEAGVDMNFGIPYLQKFFAKFKAVAKSTRQMKETLTQVIEPRLDVLIGHCNALITEIRNHIDGTGRKDLLLIIEDVDKISIEKARDLFVNYVDQLTQLHCNIIYTFPLALRFTPYFNTLKHYFTDHIELPMIEVRDRHGAEWPEGMDAMRAIAAARMDFGLFDDPALLNRMILVSGGCLRDLFSLIKEAAEHALDEERQSIGPADYEAAYLNLKREYKSSIADYHPPGRKDKISVEEFYGVLTHIATNDNKAMPDETDVAMILRENLMVLGYNGEGWCDVHPVVRDILGERGLLPQT